MTLLSSLLAIPFMISALSSILASPISKRLGLLPTMALTHLPSALILGLLPFAPSLTLACSLLILRAGLSTMDQGPRAVFLAQVVRPDERTKVMGLVNTVKTIAQSSGPTVTGSMAQRGWFGAVFVIAGALKASYDIALMGLWWLRYRKKPTEYGGLELTASYDEPGRGNEERDSADNRSKDSD